MKFIMPLLLALFASSACFGQTPISQDEARATAHALADALKEGYMDPVIGAAYGAALREKADSGAYDGLEDAEIYAEAVTADVQAVNSDAHIRLRLRTPQPQDESAAAEGSPPFEPIGDTKWIDEGVAYTEWFGFLGGEEALKHARSIMQDYAGADALIIDIRGHRGGGLSEMDIFFEYLFDAPTHLVTMKIREDKGEGMAQMLNAMATMRSKPVRNGVNSWEHWTKPADDDLGWSDTPVYLLTSGRTASAAEHLSLSFKTTGRATLVGETTRGAGHFGGGVPIGERFSCFIPVGETIDPKTGEGWEGVGIAPDVEVPADEALQKALELINAS